MTSILTDITSWEPGQVGGAAVPTITAGVATATSTAGQTARLSIRFKARPNEHIVFRMHGLNVSGTDYDAGGLALWCDGELQDEVFFDGPSWKEYEVAYIVPPGLPDESVFVQLFAGVFTDQAGTAKLANPSVEVSSGGPFMRMHACGLLRRVSGGTWDLFDQNVRCGISAVAWDVTDKALYVTTKPIANTGHLYIEPIAQVGITPNGNKAFRALMPQVGGFANTTGVFKIEFVDGTGEVVDINAMGLTETVYLNFTAFSH